MSARKLIVLHKNYQVITYGLRFEGGYFFKYQLLGVLKEKSEKNIITNHGA